MFVIQRKTGHISKTARDRAKVTINKCTKHKFIHLLTATF